MPRYQIRSGIAFILKFERCVRGVKSSNLRRGKKYNPQAVCTVSLKGRPPRRPRSQAAEGRGGARIGKPLRSS